MMRLAFPSVPRPPCTQLLYGQSYLDAIRNHVIPTLRVKRVLIIASHTMSKSTSHVVDLERALGSLRAGTSTAIRAHTYLSDLIPIVRQASRDRVDCIVTMGGSSLADGAQIIAYALANNLLLDPTESVSRAPARSSPTLPPD